MNDRKRKKKIENVNRIPRLWPFNMRSMLGSNPTLQVLFLAEKSVTFRSSSSIGWDDNLLAQWARHLIDNIYSFFFNPFGSHSYRNRDFSESISRVLNLKLFCRSVFVHSDEQQQWLIECINVQLYVVKLECYFM